ncbi:MAG: tyrosine--tRNA ligase [Myxococcota bacterium]|jgi:tyrosyl-tRNA synthetase|nr:tyrosine--tRNA ligase [Myxococcota bacterium]
MSPSQPLSPEAQLALLERGTVQIHQRAELAERLVQAARTGRPLRVKTGYDPTAPDLHLGHTVTLTKMRQFQDLGHIAVFLIGDFTGRIGDPTGKKSTRPALTKEQVLENAETYKRQVFKVLDPERTEVRFNSEWMDAMTAADLVRLASHYNLARLMEREDFRSRYQNNEPVSVHELLYPLVQAYDSVALQADVELGGTDQIFNLLVGREIQRDYGQPPQVVMTLPLLVGTDARLEDGSLVGDKMSKSLGNYIGINEPPESIFGKVMSISDPLMWHYTELLSRRTNEELASLKGDPLRAKKELGQELVARFYSAEVAAEVRTAFERRFSQHQLPDEIPEVTLVAPPEGLPLPSALKEAGLVSTTSDARRNITQGAVKVDGEKVTAVERVLATPGCYLLQKGKLGICRLRLTPASE